MEEGCARSVLEGEGEGGIRAEAVQILAFHQDTRGPASSLPLPLPLPPPAFIELLAPSLNSYHARSRNGRSSTGFFFVARPRERASNRRLLERDHHPCCGSIRQRFLTPAALHAPSDFRFQRFGVPRSITRFSSSSRLSARATFFEPTNQPRVTPPLSRRHQL